MAATKLKNYLQPVAVPENWQTSTRLLTVPELMFITHWSYWKILKLIKSRILRPALNEKPYRFDPSHIYALVFAAQSSEPIARTRKGGLRSVTIEGNGKSLSRKRLNRGDLWQK